DAVAELTRKADLGFLNEEIPLAIQQSVEGLDRVAGIVRAMKEFAHPGSKEKAPIDLNHTVETVLAVASNEWKKVADVVTELHPTLPRVPGFASELNQALLNLIVN